MDMILQNMGERNKRFHQKGLTCKVDNSWSAFCFASGWVCATNTSVILQSVQHLKNFRCYKFSSVSISIHKAAKQYLPLPDPDRGLEELASSLLIDALGLLVQLHPLSIAVKSHLKCVSHSASQRRGGVARSECWLWLKTLKINILLLTNQILIMYQAKCVQEHCWPVWGRQGGQNWRDLLGGESPATLRRRGPDLQSRNVKIKCIKNYFLFVLFFKLICAPGRRVASRTVGIKYPKLVVISLPCQLELLPIFCLYGHAHCAACFRSFVPMLNSEQCILLENNKPNIMQQVSLLQSVH